MEKKQGRHGPLPPGRRFSLGSGAAAIPGNFSAADR
jgi:hypothetical protein